MTEGRPRSGDLPRRSQVGRDLLTLAGLAAVIAGIFAQTEPGRAATATGTVAVSMTITPTCLASVAPLAFGTYTTAQNDAATSVTVTCTNSTPFTIGVNAGLQPSGNYQWNMAGPGSSLLAYRIFRDSGRTAYWGGSQGNDTVGGTGTGSAVAIPLYGRELAAQFAQPGGYADTVTLTVYY